MGDAFALSTVPIRLPSIGCRCVLTRTAPHRLIVHCTAAHGLSDATADGPLAGHLRTGVVVCATQADVLPCGELRLANRNVRVIDSFTFSMDSAGVCISSRPLAGHLKFAAYESPHALAEAFAIWRSIVVIQGC